MGVDALFSREDVLVGLPVKRAQTLLFLVESRASHMAAQSRRAMDRFISEEAIEDRDLAFLEAFTLGKDPPLKPTIQDLERYAPHWVHLIPNNAGLRAAFARLIGKKYTFTYQSVPGLRKALTLDSAEVQQAYQRHYREPITSIYAARSTGLERLRWAWANLGTWLEGLPPAWTAFALTLTETVGASILALPIALAGIGPLAGVVLLVMLGIFNIVTILYIAESLVRTGSIRYGNAFFGRLVAEHLGKGGSVIFTVALVLLNFLVLLAYYIGISKTMEAATRIPAVAWLVVLFLIGIYFLRHKSLNATITSSLVVGATNIGLILLLSLLAIPQVRMENILFINVPYLNNRPFEPSILQLVFGIALAAYFGHTSIANGAKVVLRRDPSGRSLIWGSMAAQITAIGLYTIWVLAVNGTISPQVLAVQAGTALIPLAAQVGPIVHVFGTIYVILGMGMASIHLSLGFFNLVNERLPASAGRNPVLHLPRRRGSICFGSHSGSEDSPQVNLIYLGFKGKQPQFHVDLHAGRNVQRFHATSAGILDIASLLSSHPYFRRRGMKIECHILDASHESVRLQVSSTMKVRYAGEWDITGLGLGDLLELPENQRRLVQWMVRQGEVNLAQVSAFTSQPERNARQKLEALVERGFVIEIKSGGEVRYRTHLLPKRGRKLPEEIWSALEEDDPGGKQGAAKDSRPISALASQAREWLLNERGRFLLAVSPVAAVFAFTAWLMFNNAASFVEPINFAGVIVVSLLGGIFPVLLLIASRRKGEMVPGLVFGFLGHPVIAVGVYLLSLGSLFLHGLVIWSDPIQRAVAVLAGVVMLLATFWMVRYGVFAPRLVVELRQEGSDPAKGTFSVISSGQLVATNVTLGYGDREKHTHAAQGVVEELSNLVYADFQLPPTRNKDLKVWAHRVATDGPSEGMPAVLEVQCEERTVELVLRAYDGQILVPLEDDTCRLMIKLMNQP